MHDSIPHAIHYKQQDHHSQPYRPQGQRPGKGDPAEIAQEERWIPQRGQTATDVADEKDKEYDGMGDIATLSVGLEQWADKQHRGASCAHDTGQEGPSPRKQLFTTGVACRSPRRAMPPEMV